MSRHSPNARLNSLLVEARWSAGELARAVNTLGTRYGIELRYDRTSVAHWLNGSRPRAPVPDLVAQVLSRQCDRLVSAEDTGLARLSPLRDPLVSEPTQEVSAMLRMSALCQSDADPARRALLIRTVYTLTAVSPPSWDSPAVRPSARLLRHRVTADDAEALREMTHIFARLFSGYGGGHARSALARYLADDVSCLLAASSVDRVHRRLLSLAAQLTHQLAAMTVDCGHHGLAQRHFRTSLSLAHEAGDRTTYAITLRAMSGQALALGHLRHADELAEAALAAGSGGEPGMRSFLLVQHARTQAARQESTAALAHLDSAEREHARAAGEPGPFTSYPRAGLDYQRARTLTALGRHTEALSLFQDSLRRRTPDQRKALALAQARIAETLLALGHAEAACAHWRAFLDHYPRLRSAEADEALTALRRCLASFPTLAPAVRLRKRAAEFSRY